MNTRAPISILAALVISGLGGFFFYEYGSVNYKKGYVQCQRDGAMWATEAGEQLKNVIRKSYTPSDVINRLHIFDELRDEGDL